MVSRPKVKDNVPGKYYITEICIRCSLCRETASENICMSYVDGAYYVSKQPETPEEEALCIKARQTCPADAINDDGLELSKQ